MHLRSLHAFDFDSVLFPYNFVLLERPDYRADVEALLELCAQRNGCRCRRSSRSPAAVGRAAAKASSAGTSR